ncbi:MAG: hypothetical protein Q8R57_07185 [Bacteroidota bacterium]|nr:hypothetical protein [Bacteroidota bacterium]
MKIGLKFTYLINPELNLIWVVKQQIQLVRTKTVERLNEVRFFKWDLENMVARNQNPDKKILEIPKTGNEVLDQYCLEGMKLFSQGPFANSITKNNDPLGTYL